MADDIPVVANLIIFPKVPNRMKSIEGKSAIVTGAVIGLLLVGLTWRPDEVFTVYGP